MHVRWICNNTPLSLCPAVRIYNLFLPHNLWLWIIPYLPKKKAAALDIQQRNDAGGYERKIKKQYTTEQANTISSQSSDLRYYLSKQIAHSTGQDFSEVNEALINNATDFVNNNSYAYKKALEDLKKNVDDTDLLNEIDTQLQLLDTVLDNTISDEEKIELESLYQQAKSDLEYEDQLRPEDIEKANQAIFEYYTLLDRFGDVAGSIGAIL